MKKYKIYIFDFDGTLVDSFESLYHIFDVSFKSVGITIPRESVYYLSRVSIEEGYSHFNGPLDPKSIETFTKTIIREVNSPESIKGTVAYNEVKNVLSKLVQNGATIAICTSNSKKHVYDVLDELNIDKDIFKVVVGNNEVKNHKPHPEPVLKVLEHLNYVGDGHDAVYIGDSVNDVIAGESAGIEAILVERMNEHGSFTKTKIKSLEELLN